MRKPRKHYAPAEKVAILKRHLVDQVPVSDLCDEYGTQPTIFYAWQKQFFENGAAAFERQEPPAWTTPRTAEIAALEAEAGQQKNEVIAELMEENVR